MVEGPAPCPQSTLFVDSLRRLKAVLIPAPSVSSILLSGEWYSAPAVHHAAHAMHAPHTSYHAPHTMHLTTYERTV